MRHQEKQCEGNCSGWWSSTTDVWSKDKAHTSPLSFPLCRSHINFGLLSPVQMTQLAEFQVVNRELYQLPKRDPMPYGVLDTRLVRFSLLNPPPFFFEVQAYHVHLPALSPPPPILAFLQQGISNKTGSCRTCGQKILECAGHYGCIKLALPVFHIGYLKTIIVLLHMFCKVRVVLFPVGS